jgi:hypothetical protein
VKQFIESLKVIFTTDVHGSSGIATELVRELEELLRRTTR